MEDETPPTRLIRNNNRDTGPTDITGLQPGDTPRNHPSRSRENPTILDGDREIQIGPAGGGTGISREISVGGPKDIRIEEIDDYGDRDDEPVKGTTGGSAPSKTVLLGTGDFDLSEKDAEPVRHSSGGVSDPPVGCFLIVNGPGKGRLCTIGVGQNSMGRGRNNRIVLDFGDDSISSENSITVFYEPKKRQFFLSPGSGKNIPYLVGDKAIMTVTEIKGGEEVIVGKTTLKFFPFCGEEWSWDSKEA